MNPMNKLRSEETEQMAVIQWAQYNMNQHPELKWLHHCPNGGSRKRLEAGKLKQMGVKSGVADLCLPYPRGIYCGLYIEMKYGDNRWRNEQKEFLKDMQEAGHFVATCYSAEEAVTVIKEYLSLKENMQGERYKEICLAAGIRIKSMNIPNNSVLKDGKVKAGAV